ncbi:glycoside hydrolase family 3 N-terminal domain-containing protein [Streptomyces sp. NPDC059740]|uniref:glycoside hydrolase family 3 N-terminal domain-containing protein n=1 Tax=Streptomyces sp. NPDC059740 TaxID=3346926 RepID=UPI00365D09D0
MTRETPDARPARRSLIAAALAAAGTLAVATPAHAARRGHHRSPQVTLTPRQLAGQRVVYSYPGLTPPAALLSRISAGEAGGVIFFGENISDEDQIAAVVDRLVAAHAKSPVSAPLLLTTDQEGGSIRRLPGGPEQSQKEVGRSGDPDVAAQAGTEAGRNLAGVGMNANLAPVLGVYREAGDFLDRWGRSYGTDPQEVAELAAAFVTAQQDTGVAATAKHFPGLGAAGTDANTDEGPVTLDQSLAELRTVDEAPYPAAIRAGVAMVMASWAVYPALDAERPAGLSARAIRQELRGRLGFRGVTVTDALEAKALAAFGGTGQRAVLAADAGMDLLLCSARDVDQGDEAASALVTALAEGDLPEDDFRGAVERVLELRSGLS